MTVATKVSQTSLTLRMTQEMADALEQQSQLERRSISDTARIMLGEAFAGRGVTLKDDPRPGTARKRKR